MANRAKIYQRTGAVCLFLWLSMLLAGCGDNTSGPLLSQVTAEAGRLDLSNGLSVEDALSVNYSIGQPAKISATLEGPGGFSQQLRLNEERAPGDYQLRLNGSYELEEAGLGAADSSIGGLLLVSINGINSATASAATLLIRFCTLWFGVTLGIITLFVFRKRFERGSQAKASLQVDSSRPQTESARLF